MSKNILPFGTRVKAAREALSMSQQALAAAADIPHGQQINRIETTGTASLDAAVRLANALGVSLDYLTGRNDSEPEIQRRIKIMAEIESLKAQL